MRTVCYAKGCDHDPEYEIALRRRPDNLPDEVWFSCSGHVKMVLGFLPCLAGELEVARCQWMVLDRNETVRMMDLFNIPIPESYL